MTPPHAPLVLASRSPRRATLLERAGFPFEVLPSADDDRIEPGDARPPEQIALFLARSKAEAVAMLRPDAIVLGSDTLVVAAGRMLGKPTGAQDARRMLESLFDVDHRVVTAVWIALPGTVCPDPIVDTAIVRIPRPPRRSVETWIADGRYLGKAGGYNLDEIATDWNVQVTGDPTTVVGLPMRRLEPLLDGLMSRR